MKFKEGDKVKVRGFIEKYCHHIEPPSSSWQHDVYMAELNNETCTIRNKRPSGESVSIRIPSANDSWWLNKGYLRLANGLEGEATEL